jgi:hypothetical protein
MAAIAPPLKSRVDWGALYGRGSDASGYLPWNEVVIHTEAGAVRDEDWLILNDLDPTLAGILHSDEAAHMRAIEHYHSVNLGWSGVGYSFVIFPDGTICEGRGWGRSGAHTETRNYTAAAFCFTGHGDLMPATAAQWASAKWLIGEGIRLGHLTPNPKITGHRNYSQKGKSCPGDMIYPLIGQLRDIYGPMPWGLLDLNTPNPSDQEVLNMAADMIVRESDTDRKAVWAIDVTTVLPGQTKAGARRWLGRRTLDGIAQTMGHPAGWSPPEVSQQVIIQFPIAPGGDSPTL